MKYVLIAITWAVVTAAMFWFAQEAYTAGHKKGYAEGQASMVQTPEQVLQQCTQWWFGDGNSRAKQAINQYCERNKK